jgi:DNA-binding NtrC family response regulator
MKDLKVWIITEQASAVTDDLRTILRSRGRVEVILSCFSSQETRIALAGRLQDAFPFLPDLMFVVCRESEKRGCLDLLVKSRDLLPERPLIAIADGCGVEHIRRSLKLGACDFVCAPLTEENVLPRLESWVPQLRSNRNLVARLRLEHHLKNIIGEHPSILDIKRRIKILADREISLLILGETGTGKELCARAIHYLSRRRRMPFVPVNCGALPSELIENELFGHEAGSYTDARTARVGLVGEAAAGTLFLDEIDCLPPTSQVKFLRLLQEKEYRPIGASRSRRIDVRILAATNSELEQAVTNGTFRADLYYRLNAASLRMPPLRTHRQDIPLLVQNLISKYAYDHGRRIRGVSDQVLALLCRHDWPGNVRELENVIERAVIFSDGSELQPADFDFSSSSRSVEIAPLKEAKAKVVANFEKSYIEAALLAHAGNITKAARSAGKHRRAFWELIRKYDIDIQSLHRNAEK